MRGFGDKRGELCDDEEGEDSAVGNVGAGGLSDLFRIGEVDAKRFEEEGENADAVDVGCNIHGDCLEGEDGGKSAGEGADEGRDGCVGGVPGDGDGEVERDGVGNASCARGVMVATELNSAGVGKPGKRMDCGVEAATDC